MDRTTPPWLTGLTAFHAALNIFLSITASFGNILILIALRRVTSLYTPSKFLFRCLAVTDLCVGLISQPLHSTYLMSYIEEMNFNIIRFISEINSVLSVALCTLSLVTSTAISLDRLQALFVGNEIQTSCNFETNSGMQCMFVDVKCFYIGVNVFMEPSCSLDCSLYLCNTLPGYLYFLLHRD